MFLLFLKLLVMLRYWLSPDYTKNIAEGLSQVLEDTSLRQDLRARGLAQARRFTWERSARHLMQIYRDLLA